MRTNDVIIFLQEYMQSVFDDGTTSLEMWYDPYNFQHCGKLDVKYGGFSMTFPIILDEYKIQKQIVDFCNYVVRTVKQGYTLYLRKEK